MNLFHSMVQMKDVIKLLLGLGFSLLIVNNASAYDGVNRLEKIGFSTLPGNRVQINLDFSGKASLPFHFSTDNPARIVLDFPNVVMGLETRSQPIGIGTVESATAVETSDRTRVVLNLVRMVPFEIESMGTRTYIVVENVASIASSSGSNSLATNPPSSEPQAQPLAVPSPPVAQPLAVSSPYPVQPVAVQPLEVKEFRPTAVIAGPAVNNVDFRRTESGAGQIVVDLSDPSIIVDMRTEGMDIVVDFLKAKLPERFDRRMDVMDFATPVTIIDSFQSGENVRMRITAKGNYEHLAYQSENHYVIEVKEIVETSKEALEAKQTDFKGQKISFNFQSIEIRAALMLIADLAGFNIVVPETVKGSVTLQLKNVPWDQALNIILESNQLGMEKIGNVVMIDKRATIDKRKQEELAAQEAIRKLEPLRTEYIQINYAKASDIAALLRVGGQNGYSFLSERGNVSVDVRTNKLIIQDTAAKLAEIRDLIASLDTPTRQVLIESRIVIANDTFARNLGIKFGYSANQDLGNNNGMVFGGKMAGDTQFAGGTAFSGNNSGSGGSGENYIVSLPAAGPSAAVGLAIGKIGSYLLQLELSASESEGMTKVISSPRVITGNQQEAKILQGTEIPYRTISEGGTQTEFKNAVLELKVTPQITPDDRVIMNLNVKSDKVSEITNDGQLAIDKREVQTQILVDNGETIVLGGVYEQESRQGISRVPFLSDLPLIGDLFKSTSNRNEKRELLIFVTPKIVKETT